MRRNQTQPLASDPTWQHVSLKCDKYLGVLTAIAPGNLLVTHLGRLYSQSLSNHNKDKLSGFSSASELYRLRGRRWYANFSAGTGVSRGQRNGSPRPLISIL
jgi:hypothetical protein